MKVDGSDQVLYGLRREEHIVVCYSVGKYLTYFTPDEGMPEVPTALAVTKYLVDFLKEN